MKPGKPLTFAEINTKPAQNANANRVLAFGLPGNPVSCLVCFHLFVVPTIRCLSGRTNSNILRLLIIFLFLSILVFSSYSVAIIPMFLKLSACCRLLYRVHVRLEQPLKTDPARPEFHRAIITWKENDGSGNPG